MLSSFVDIDQWHEMSWVNYDYESNRTDVPFRIIQNIMHQANVSNSTIH